nr:hypothetical protein [Halogeometricum sp. CBA1124]
MEVTIRCYGDIADAVGEQSLTRVVERRSTVDDVIRGLAAEFDAFDPESVSDDLVCRVNGAGATGRPDSRQATPSSSPNRPPRSDPTAGRSPRFTSGRAETPRMEFPDIDTVDELVDDVSFPTFATVRQTPDTERVADVPAAARDAVERLLSDRELDAGASVAVGLGSRGITTWSPSRPPWSPSSANAGSTRSSSPRWGVTAARRPRASDGRWTRSG